jgi:DNA mismatch repair protein MutS
MIFPRIIKALSEADVPLLKQLVQSLEGFDPIASKIDAAIVDNPPLSIREGGMIKAGVNAELDEIRNASVNGKQWIAKLQETEKETHRQFPL